MSGDLVPEWKLWHLEDKLDDAEQKIIELEALVEQLQAELYEKECG
jgi:hypothetical protein